MTDARVAVPHEKQRPFLKVAAVILLVAGAGWVLWYAIWWRPSIRGPRLLSRARIFRQAGDHLAAERSATLAVELVPGLADAALLAAESAAAQGEYSRAVLHAELLLRSPSRLRNRGALLIADWNHHQLHRLSEAERAYRIVLEAEPDHLSANEGLAKLLGLCGRRREAIPHVLRIVRLGEPTDLLFLLAREDSGVNDSEMLNQARQAAPDDPNPLVGLAWQAAVAERTDEAITLLKSAIEIQSRDVAAHVALGRQLLLKLQFDELIRWNRQLLPAAEDFPEVWLVRARMCEQVNNTTGAIRCYWESIRRSPESKTANYRMERLLVKSGDTTASKRFGTQGDRLRELETIQDRVLFSSQQNQIEPMLELARSFSGAGRTWEAYGWCLMAVQSAPDHVAARNELAKLHRQVQGLPLRMTIDSANPATSVVLDSYPLPQFGAPQPGSGVADDVGNSAQQKMPSLSFRDDATAAGLQFRYFNGMLKENPGHRMFEFTGGGIGVLDYDLDGCADVWCTQGRPWDEDSSLVGTSPESLPYQDQFFRNLAGRRFQNSTSAARLRDSGFGQGVTVGDFNSDGFPDVYVANIGANQLWLNHGDGTFSDVTAASGLGGKEWTTSCVLADLNGDGLPDLYDINYVMGRDVFDRVCRGADGQPTMCMPFDFEGQPDRLWLNDGDGRFTDATTTMLPIIPNGKGLGVAVWSGDGSGRLSLFVANDTTPGFLFTPIAGEGSVTRLEERGMSSGLALNGDGKATGSMGIALGDVNDDGLLDLHVTNFLGESNTLFTSQGPGLFEDQTRSFGLHSTPLDVLGFGTQFLDADLDGRLELFAANGHIDDLLGSGRPYRMPPLLFRSVRSGAGTDADAGSIRYVRVPTAELGPYFQTKWLGRSAARLDWNSDGRDDLIVGHLHDASALLTNTTPDAGRFLSLRLFGVQSNRDAIGTTVKVRLGKRTVVRQLTAGDGYQASNERRIIIGVGSNVSIDELSIHWPSGSIQKFHNVSTPDEVWLTEGGPLRTAPR